MDMGQMLRHRPGATVTSAGAAGMKIFHMMAIPAAGWISKRPASAKPASSSTICRPVQTVREVIPGAGLAAFAALAWRVPRRSVFTGSKARKDACLTSPGIGSSPVFLF